MSVNFAEQSNGYTVTVIIMKVEH